VRAWWYVGGIHEPYTPEDSTWYVPLYFFSLGVWQWLFGDDPLTSRLFSVALTAVNMALLALPQLSPNGCRAGRDWSRSVIPGRTIGLRTTAC
jgi:hypothetical protein